MVPGYEKGYTRDRWVLVTSAEHFRVYLETVPRHFKAAPGIVDEYRDLQLPESFPCLVETHLFKPDPALPGQSRRLIKRFHRFVYLGDAKMLLETAIRMKKAGQSVGAIPGRLF